MKDSVKTEPYDTTWVVTLLKSEHPKEKNVIKNLSKIKKRLIIGNDPAMVYFVDPSKEYSVKNNLVVESEKGDVVIDVLKDDEVGALELTWLIRE